MGLFNKKNEGGLMDVIRCDQEEYLVWKWRPVGADVNSTKKENSIRYGSSLRVKEGEVAVFVYPQKDGTMQDFIEGPFDQTIKTGNFPILASIVGSAFGGKSPFQAEIYFINLSEIINSNFAVPFFDVFDPRFLDYGVPVAVRGSYKFKIKDYKEFIKLHRLINFDMESFQKQVKDAVVKYTKGIVSNIPSDKGIPVIQLERKILEISDAIQEQLKSRLESEFGVVVSSLDVNALECDKTSEGYRQLKAVTQDITTQTFKNPFGKMKPEITGNICINSFCSKLEFSSNRCKICNEFKWKILQKHNVFNGKKCNVLKNFKQKAQILLLIKWIYKLVLELLGLKPWAKWELLVVLELI